MNLVVNRAKKVDIFRKSITSLKKDENLSQRRRKNNLRHQQNLLNLHLRSTIAYNNLNTFKTKIIQEMFRDVHHRSAKLVLLSMFYHRNTKALLSYGKNKIIRLYNT